MFVGKQDLQPINLQNNFTTNFIGGLRRSVEPQLNNVFTADFRGGLVVESEQIDVLSNFVITADDFVISAPSLYRILAIDTKTRRFVVDTPVRTIQLDSQTRSHVVDQQNRTIEAEIKSSSQLRTLKIEGYND